MANSNAREANSVHQPRNSSEGVTPYIPPHVSAAGRNGANGDLRYSKEKFLDIFKAERDAGTLLDGVEGLYVRGFHPSASNGMHGVAWGRGREEQKDDHSVDRCWDRNAQMLPMSLKELTDEERDVCARLDVVETLY